MIEDTELIQTFIGWFKDLGPNSSEIEAYRLYQESDVDYYEKMRRESSCVDIFSKSLRNIGIGESDSYRLARSLMGLLYIWKIDDISDEKLREIISEAGAQWKRPDKTIDSREYWEMYFKDHPEQRPKHVYYYRGSPSVAIHDFLEKHGIGEADTSKDEGQLLGFDDHHVILREGLASAQDDPRALTGYDDLMSMGSEIIREHYLGGKDVNG